MRKMTNKQRRAYFAMFHRPQLPEPVECLEIDDSEPWPEIDTEINNIVESKTNGGYLPKHSGINLDGMTLEEVAQIEGVTRERIRQIEAKALRKLKDPQVTQHLRIFLTA